MKEETALALNDFTGLILDDDPTMPSVREGKETKKIPLIRHEFQAGLLKDGDEFLDYVEGVVIKFRTTLYRNYETPYREDDIQPPTCFSLNGEDGYRPSEVRTFGEKKVRVYGRCKECYFNTFKTGEIWRDAKNPRPGKNCGQYAILWMMTRQGELRGIQIPPTGVGPIDDGINRVVQRIPGADFGVANKLWWRVLPKGGGKQQKYISIRPISKVTPDEFLMVRDVTLELVQWDEEFYYNFVSGGSLSEKAVEEEETAVTGEEDDEAF